MEKKNGKKVDEEPERLEDIAKELKELAKNKPLSDTDLVRAKQLMYRLKEFGFTNRQINEITDGGWSESTVKLYTRGATVKNLSQKKNAVDLLTQLINMDLSLEDVEIFVSIKKNLDSKNVGFQDILNLLGEADGLKVDPKEIVATYLNFQNSGLSVRQLSEILSSKAELDKMHVTIELMDEILQASKVYGDAGKILEALKSYGALGAIQEDIKKTSSEKENLQNQVNGLKLEVTDLEKRKDAAKDSLATYERIKTLGFDEPTFKRLKASAEKFGRVDSVLDAVNSFVDLSEIKRKKDDLESELKKVEADHAHLATIIEICKTLLYKYKFSIAAINDIYEAARNYGDPLQVLKAINLYGETLKIRAEIDTLNKNKEQLKATVKELGDQSQQLEATIKALRASVDDALAPIRNEITKNVDYVIKKFVETLADMSVQYEQYAQRYGELKAEAGKLEEDLKLGRIMLLLIKYPSEARQVPLEYDALILSGIVNHCRAMGINPTLKLQDVVESKLWAIGSYSVTLVELLEWSLKGLRKSIPHV